MLLRIGRWLAEAVINVVLNKRLFSCRDCTLDCVELLGKLSTWPLFLKHFDDFLQMA